MMHLHCLLLRYFRQGWISTRTVDKPISKLLAYSHDAARPEQKL
jgi:hypothetical protein